MKTRMSTQLIKTKLNETVENTQHSPDNQSSDPFHIPLNDLTVYKKIAEGMYSFIYLGTWNHLTVAIKTEKAPTNRYDISLEKENQLMQSLHSPYIVHYYGYSRYKKNIYVILEYMPKGSLVEHFNAKPFPWPQRYNIMQDIARGLHYLHQNKILHRDLKPENIFLDKNLRAKIGDFGFAKLIDGEIEKHCMGSPHYMAPEIIHSKIYSEKSDIYSLAITYWEIAAWRCIFEAIKKSTELSTLEAILEMIIHGKREPIPENCPSKIAKLITFGWDNNPHLRPSAEEFVSKLETNINESLEESEKLCKLKFN